MVTTTGMISPSSFAVRALKFLQKSMMFTPCGPSAVPTGGAGVALAAGICSFTIACTFFAMLLRSLSRARRCFNHEGHEDHEENNLLFASFVVHINVVPSIRSF